MQTIHVPIEHSYHLRDQGASVAQTRGWGQLGNSTEETTNENIEVGIVLKNHKFAATLQLMDLPCGFNVIVGMDFMTRHNVRWSPRAS